MAKLYPESIDRFENIPEPEKRLFEKFNDLDDSCHVFHSITWSYTQDNGCDFIIFGEHKGFIALEVYGGKIDFDGRRWSSVDPDGKLHYAKDPVMQARDSMRAIMRVYEDRFNTPFPGIHAWGVCFIDCNRGSGFSSLEIHGANIFDLCESPDIINWVDKLFRVGEDYNDVSTLTADENKKFISMFCGELHIPFSMRKVAFEKQRKFVSADLLQEHMLDLFEDKNRVAFRGAAGTGKTRIAIKKAVRLAASGRRVLFVCCSRYVCEFAGSELEAYRNISVMTFHSFANTVIREYVASVIRRFGCEEDFFSCIEELLNISGEADTLSAKRRLSGGKNLDLRVHGALFSLDTLQYGENYDNVLTEYEGRLPIDIIDIISLLMPDGTGRDHFYNERIPLALSQVFEEEQRYIDKFIYDAVIIDEGHDFQMSWCDSLQNLFEKYKNRTVYVFYDDNQSLFRREGALPIMELISKTDPGSHVFRLIENIRNTDDIQMFAVQKTGLGAEARPPDIQGVIPVEAEFNCREDAVYCTGSLIYDLIHSHNVDSESIVILSNRSIDRSVFSDERKAGDYMLAHSENCFTDNCIKFRTIHEFRGLESDVVILMLHKREEEFADKNRYLSEELIYTGLTRARCLLYLFTVIP